MQTDALRKAGCERIFDDTASGAKAERPGLMAALAFLRDGDVLVVWRLDRLGRSLPHLVEVVSTLEARGVRFCTKSRHVDNDLCKLGIPWRESYEPTYRIVWRFAGVP